MTSRESLSKVKANQIIHVQHIVYVCIGLALVFICIFMVFLVFISPCMLLLHFPIVG